MCPFDGSGNYALSDTIAPATNADANELQAILTDIATALDNCVAADGQSSMTGTLKLPDGDATAPALRFVSDTNSGLYRIGADNVGLSLGGTKRWDFGTAGSSITGTLTASGQILSSDGTKTAPGYSFSGDLDTGFYRIGANNLGVSCGDTKIIDVTTSGVAITGTLSASGAVTLSSTLAISGALSGVTTLSMNGAISGVTAVAVQRLTSGSGATFTPAANAVRWRIRMCGGGSGGSASNLVTAPTAGGTTSFQVNSTGTAWTCGGGSAGGGVNAGVGGTGGTDGSTGTKIDRRNGGTGHGGQATSAATVQAAGSSGGTNPFGGAGSGAPTATTGGNAVANSGGGGGGGGASSGHNSGGGGGAGEYVEFWVTGMTTATYTVGAGGAGTPVGAGDRAGGDGAAGIIIIEEYYS